MIDPLELGRLTDRRPPFKYSALTRVWFSDTDAQGVVYYGRYLPYFDHARTEYHRHLGSLGVEGAEFVMRASSVEYHAPARFDDLLECFVRVSRLGRTSVTYEVAALRLPDDQLLVTGAQTVVLIDPATRTPIPVPEPVRAMIRSFERRGRARVSERALAEVDRILTLGSDPDDVLRAVVATLGGRARGRVGGNRLSGGRRSCPRPGGGRGRTEPADRRPRRLPGHDRRAARGRR